jgi:holliday junction DNA helicase RuvA
MITRITGKLVQLEAQAAILAAGPFEYEVLIPEFVRRQLQASLGAEVSLKTIEYLEGNAAQGGKLVPRIIGFMSDADGVGVKKALRSMVRPVRDVATAIEEQDIKQLSTLPGIGAALAERIVAKLRRKMTKFALLIQRDLPPDQAGQVDLFQTALEALISLGHSPNEARDLIEKVAATRKKFKEVDEVLIAIYELKK